ncbi:MAG TPA: MtrB/PioB family outer membrane beta-barrel protein, partial [Dissulfurispiraceae bacterium]
ACISTTLPALAEQRMLEGEAGLDGSVFDVKGNKAKLDEYRDRSDVQAGGRLKLFYDADAWSVRLKARDFGYDTQSYRLDGGIGGVFKGDVFYREIPHNITFGAQSVFNGTGSGNLTLPAGIDVTNPSTWPSTFDYFQQRRQAGASASLDSIKPFFLNASALYEKRKGNKPAGVTLDPGNLISLEFPEPVNYRTTTVKAEFGYSQKPLFADIYFMYSDFNNKTDVLNFDNFGITGAPVLPPTPDTLTLPPDNRYYKIGFKGALKLPFYSRLSVNTGWSRTTSDTPLLTSEPILSASALTLSNSSFKGKIETTNVDAALATNPAGFLDAEIFYKYYNRDNDSDTVTETDAAGNVFVNRLFSYQENRIGGELVFSLPLKLSLETKYEHALTKQPLDTLADTKDDIYSAEVRWKGLDFVTVRTGYERLVRSADFHQPIDRTAANPLNPRINLAGAGNFDVTDKTRDTVKLVVDMYPADFLSAGLGFKHIETNYRQLQFGLKSDRRDEVFARTDLTIGKVLQPFGYFDYEWTRRDQDQEDPSIAPAAMWSLKDKVKYYDVGAGANIFLLPKRLTLRVQYDYTKSDGHTDLALSDSGFTGAGTVLPAGANNDNISIPNADDYTRQSIIAKLIYDATKNIAFAVGYAYQKFRYSDAQLDNYTLVPGDGGAFLTGAYRDQSYHANIFLASLTYKIW